MDRNTVFVGEIPLDTNFLQMQRNIMIALGFQLRAIVGNVTASDGLPCTPTSPASLSVNIGPGSMMTPSVVDANAWGSLPADSSDALVKMGINLGSNTFTFVAPGSTGYSQVFLIEGQMQETDASSIVLPYVNAANPNQPWSGPNNSGVPQYAQRIQRVALESVAGTPAVTGSQTSPGVTSGWTPLWLITIANNQTTITAANIVQADGAPFIMNKLSQLPTVLQANTTFYVSPYGNDANSGRLPTPSSAWATFSGAWQNLCSNYDCNGYSVVIQAVGGVGTTFAGGSLGGSPIGLTKSASVQILGNTTSPDNFIISGNPGTCMYAGPGVQVQVSGFTVQANGTGFNGNGFFADQGSVIHWDHIVFAGCSQAANQVSGSGRIAGNNWTLTTGGTQFAYAANSGSSITILTTANGSPVAGAFSDAFATATNAASISFLNSTSSGPPNFTGTCTGRQFSVTLNGIVQNGSVLPGSGNAQSTGGQYS